MVEQGNTGKGIRCLEHRKGQAVRHRPGSNLEVHHRGASSRVVRRQAASNRADLRQAVSNREARHLEAHRRAQGVTSPEFARSRKTINS